MLTDVSNFDVRNIRGLQFELFLYGIFSKSNVKNLSWNVEYKKSPRIFRQVDLEYISQANNIPRKVLIEAKYTSNSSLNYWLRDEKFKNGRVVFDPMDNLLTEVLERQYFVGADQSIIITNSDFDKHMYRRADYLNNLSIKNNGFPILGLIDGAKLESHYSSLSGKKESLYDAITSINIDSYKSFLKKTTRLI